MPKGRNHLITLPRVVVIQSKRLLTGAHFLFKFDLVFHSSFGPKSGSIFLGESRELTAFGSSLRKLFRIHFLSPLFIVPLDYLSVFLFGAFLSSSCRFFLLSGVYSI